MAKKEESPVASSQSPEAEVDASAVPNEAVGEARAVDQDLDALRAADVTRERDEYLDLAQRTKADFENYKKRVAKESAEAERRGTAKLVRELLPVVDNLERALREAGDDSFAEGVRLVHRELREAFDRLDVESFEPAGEKFDPSLHEALATRGQEGSDPGIVLDVVDKGYRLNGQVLRPARVVVSE